MPDAIERTLAAVLSDQSRFGQLFIQRTNSGGFVLCHRDDENVHDWEIFRRPQDAGEIARYDDAGKYRLLKTAPNLRHGWRLELGDLSELRCALDYFYPGRLAMLAAWTENQLSATPLRQTLDRQSGMYRVAAKISDEQANEVVANFCRSDGGCLRTILWKRNVQGAVSSTKLPPEKFDPTHDQVCCSRRPVGDGRASHSEAATIPLLCQEACNLLVAECRKIVKAETDE